MTSMFAFKVITVTANVTANHLGHFEYKICPNNDVTVEATQECLDMWEFTLKYRIMIKQ